MPRSGVNGTYTLPPNTDNQQPLTPISSSMFNSAMDDVEQTFNTPTPVAYGGTGASDAVGARAELGVDFYDGAMSLTAAQQGQARANIGAGVLAGFRNKIINGDFDIWQRGTALAGTGYLADRWFGRSVGGSISQSRQVHPLGQTDVPGNPQYFHRSVVTHASGAANGSYIEHKVENVATLAGKMATITFYASATLGQPVSITVYQNFGTGGSPSATVTIPPDVIKHNTGGSFTKIQTTVGFPSIAGKTIGSDGNDYIMVRIWFEAGSNYDSITDNLGQRSGTYNISRVSLVEGDATKEADPFSPRHIQQEISLCQRYYFILNQALYTTLPSSNSSFRRANIIFPVTMRATPSVTGTTSSGATPALPAATMLCRVQIDAGNSTSTVNLDTFSADAEL